MRRRRIVEQREHFFLRQWAEEIALAPGQVEARAEAVQHRRGFEHHPFVRPAVAFAVRLPGGCRVLDLAPLMQVVAVLLQPVAQALPTADQRFVRDFDGVLAAAGVAAGNQQARRRQLGDQPPRALVEVTERRAPARVFAAFAELHELQEDIARDRLAARSVALDGVDDAVGTLDDRAVHATDRLVRRLAQVVVLAARVELRQAELEQRQIARLVADVAEDAADQTWLEAQPGDLRRAADRQLAFGGGHSAEEERLVVFAESAQVAVRTAGVERSLAARVEFADQFGEVRLPLVAGVFAYHFQQQRQRMPRAYEAALEKLAHAAGGEGVGGAALVDCVVERVVLVLSVEGLRQPGAAAIFIEQRQQQSRCAFEHGRRRGHRSSPVVQPARIIVRGGRGANP
ncbi:MAG: hypothetical protein CAPSK01_003232 [Candidatus Accumulibacter vicinus]|uniref:Uncharacterized protein n=1 Tax=Candidatus Accumulibacter vicinus TaxID=2954382 RepID=A0A084XY20_9PROT|nr:MAG: hypothetical protein CAPSK01_003232 [Candidatus Accumulibacter vicinus]